ncbi:MAG: MarC family protein [Lentisphaerota bacterium]
MIFGIIVIFLITLGPLKVMLPFILMTEKLEVPTKRKIALKAAFISTIIVFCIAILGPYIMSRWDVSTPAISLVIAILLFSQAFRMINMSKNASSLFDIVTEMNKLSAVDKLAYTLSIPYIVSPAGVAGILCIKLFNPAHYFEILTFVFGVLLVIMFLNYLAMIYAQRIVKVISVPILILIGWIFSIFQLILALQIVLMVLKHLKVLDA